MSKAGTQTRVASGGITYDAHGALTGLSHRVAPEYQRAAQRLGGLVTWPPVPFVLRVGRQHAPRDTPWGRSSLKVSQGSGSSIPPALSLASVHLLWRCICRNSPTCTPPASYIT